MDETLLRAELRSVSTISGAQFVTIFGQMMMAMWSVDSLDSLQLVHTKLYTSYICTFAIYYWKLVSHCKLHQLQVQSFTLLPSLVLQLALSGLTMCTALV